MALENKLIEFRKSLYRKQGYWGDATLADYWHMAVLAAPEKTAVVDLQGASYTYKELDEASGRVASFLRDAGVGVNDYVSFQIPGWAEFTVIYVACLKVGAVSNPILPSLRYNDVTYILNKCGSKVYFGPSEYNDFDFAAMMDSIRADIPSLKQTVIVEKYKKIAAGTTLEGILSTYAPQAEDVKHSADDIAAVLFTSGTEGMPKGVMLTHNNIIASEKAFTTALNITYLDTILMSAPTAHAIAFHHGVTTGFMVVAKCVLEDRFHADSALELIEREKCTCSMGPSPFVYDIIHLLREGKKYDISSLRFFLCGGAPIPPNMYNDAKAAGFKMLGIYGSTESVPHVTHRLDDGPAIISSTDGTPLAGIEIKITDEARREVPIGVQGEEASRGPNVFVGYLNDPEKTAAVFDDEGWYYSGDYCVADANGYIRITGRKKDLIIRGGENLSSVEIENGLLQHPNIRETAVVGMPDERLGERICAYVVLNDAAKPLTKEAVQDFFAEHKIAKYKCPERIEIVEKLPRTASGKVQKFLLREDIKKKLGYARV